MDRLRLWEHVGDHGDRDAGFLGLKIEDEALFSGFGWRV